MSVNARQVIDAVRAIVITGTVAMAAVTLLSIATRIELGGHFSWYAARAAGVYFSFYLRPLIGYKTWRAFHYAAFGVFVLATLHGLLARTDTGAVWALALYGAGTASVVTLLLYRIAGRPSEGRKSIIV